MREIEGIEKVVAHLKGHWAEIDTHFEAENSHFKTLLRQEHDLLGRLLKCHLMIEHYLERYLVAHYGIVDLSDAKLTFFQKAKMLPDGNSAVTFVKPGILKLNSIRNRFGHTLEPDLDMHELGPIWDVLRAARENVEFDSPIAAIEAFTTVAATFLIVPPPHIQELFLAAFSEIRVNAQ